ncbi:trypsin-like serine protease [Agrococcus sp. ARC_14]|uniref:trypsin-like serine protease n=1 Tax=Agrococcus sp. ARC_14 TaxID=2919927 RepID=UPI001F057A8E|nr:trypsin-like serine protease [Agrococcus sp. ARC_14]MCH1883904.1 S1 family peptidase [Agrococcus sp. ARC_14]
MRRRSLIIAVTAALGVIAAAVVAPVTPSAAADDLAEVQEAHFAVIDQIASWDALTPVPRLGQIEGDPVAGTIDIGWVGAVPSEVRAIADAAATEGIDVTFVPQESSEQELLEVAYGLAASMPSDGAFAIGIGADTLSVEVPTAEVAESVGSEHIALEGEVLDVIDDAEQAAAEFGAQVTVEETDSAPVNAANTQLQAGTALEAASAANLSAGRTNDTSVLSGGMRVETQWASGGWVSCTSGFTGTFGHRPLIVTAAHCSDYADGRAVRNAADTRIGTSDLVRELNDGARPYDLGVIAASYDARTLPRIYTNETSTVNITRSQNTWPPAGYRLCSSGQVTGWKCDLTAGEAYVTCYSTPRGAECMHVQIVRSSGASAFCLGDSGGPIVSLPTSQGAIAVGVVSGVKSRVSVRCSQEGLIAPISQLMTAVEGLQLHTLNRP